MTRTKLKKSMKREELFSVSGDNKGLPCPFKHPTICQEGFCRECQIYLDWQKLREVVVMCAWCGKELYSKPSSGQSGVSHGVCLECQRRYFPKTLSREKKRVSET